MSTRRDFLESVAALTFEPTHLNFADTKSPTLATIFADFEDGGYDGWSLTGSCWT